MSKVQSKSDDFLFPSRIKQSPHLSTRQYARIVEAWVPSIGLDPAAHGTHSFRRTRSLRAVQLLLGRTKLESTVRYVSIEVDDALEMAKKRPMPTSHLPAISSHSSEIINTRQ